MTEAQLLRMPVTVLGGDGRRLCEVDWWPGDGRFSAEE